MRLLPLVSERQAALERLGLAPWLPRTLDQVLGAELHDGEPKA